MRFKQFLVEGLIKVPNEMMIALVGRAHREYISYLVLKGKDEFAKHLAQKYGVIPDSKFEIKNIATDIDTKLNGVSDKVKSIWRTEFGYIRFVIDWEQKIWNGRPKVMASYEESDTHSLPGYFTINPFSFMALVDSEECTLQKLIDIFEKLKSSMWHEASHAIQHNALKWVDPNQVGKSRKFRDDPNSSKEDKRAEYLTAAVEFDPTLKTKIGLFRRKYGNLEGKDILNAMCKFVGAVISDTDKPDEFFITLKQRDFKKWKKAVKLFYLNFGFNIDDLLKPM